MSQGLMPSQSNLKKVLRTALVGVKPADQVMIKGYLRVLLRLEADLEWVSANHPQVDLFMINNDFRQAASITKLLSNQAQKPVLYVSRTDIDEGWIKQDRLILPLKKLDALNDWLMTSVGALKQGAGAVTTILQQSDVNRDKSKVDPAATNPSPHSALKVSGSSNLSSINRRSNPVNESQPTVEASKPNFQQEKNSAQPLTDYSSLIALIKQLKAKSEGRYQLQARGECLAIIAPKEGRLWYQNATVIKTSFFDWQLMPYQGTDLKDAEAYDLAQWLWQQAWDHADSLLPLANDSATYRLASWVKPEIRSYAPNVTDSHAQSLNKKERQQLLWVMTALELAPKSVNELAATAGISVKTVKKIIVSLLFSASLQQDSYEKLDSRLLQPQIQPQHLAVNHRVSDNNTANQKAATVDQPAEMSNDAQAANQADLATDTANQADETSPAAPEMDAAQAQKMGFLSRLRRKLGI